MTWAVFIRQVVGVTADLTIVAWAIAYAGRSPHIPSWLAWTLALAIFAIGGLVYFLTMKEFEQLIYRDRSRLGRLWRVALAMAFLQLISAVPAMYGLAIGRP